MRFENRAVLELLWLIPAIWVVAYLFERRGRSLLAKAFGAKLAPFLTASASPGRRRLKLVFRLLALACFIVALARPQMGASLQEVKAQGVEIMFAFDVSTSMLAEDVKPSRLQYAKSELMRLLDMLGGDKVGLVAFAGSATTISPLTTDKSALKMFVEALSPESVQTQGTDFQKALNESKHAFDRGGADNDDSEGVANKVTRVILILSDGEDQEEGALAEARKLVNDGTRIFTVAFGTEKGGPIPLRDERGFLRGYKHDRKGSDVITQVHDDFLRKLAEVGQGSFHHAAFGDDDAKLIRTDLDRLQKAEFSTSLATSYDERFQIPLAIGLFFALLDLMIGESKGEGRIWKGRFEVSQS